MGGAPELPEGAEWPRRDAYPHGRMLNETLGNRGPEHEQAFVSPMPLSFIGQLDLEEIARLDTLGDKLPARGRLYFFWDAICGTWIDGTDGCRVIWDSAPAASLRELAVPAELVVEKGSLPGSGLFPTTPVSCRAIWSIPDHLPLKELAEDEGMRLVLEDEDYEEVWDEIMDNGPGVLDSGRKVLAHRLCGWPIPEQWDPRFTAAASARGVRLFDRKPTPEEREACNAEMHDWTLLLQVGLNDLWSGFAEGTVYFVMREDDLKQRNFDRVHAIYQQT
jgi:uncharacterized protein YwqG